MKCYQLLLLSGIGLLALAGCTNNDTGQDIVAQKSEETAGMTEFAVKEATVSTASRTMGIYSGTGIDFYWTEGDKLWINNSDATPALSQSTRDNIATLLAEGDGKKTTTAKFYFSGTYTAPSYPVRYTGNGSVSGDKVTIKAQQSQQEPNDGSHIGTDGDCGTATATRNGGRYDFTLEHKASYLTFTPYYSHGFATDVKVTQIKVTADQPIAGTYDFDDTGILTNNATATSTSITLTLNGGGTNGFIIPKAASYADNAAIMVLAPGVYTNFTVEYSLYDQVTKVHGTVTKKYPNLTFTAGKNKKAAVDLAVPHYDSNIYYMWDAAVGQHAWNGRESSQPILTGQSNTNYPLSESDTRWYNPVAHPNRATRSAANSPNANELRWIAEKGAPHWDPSIWSIMTHLYSGGMWLKKRSVIAAENGKTLEQLKSASPNGTDFGAISSDPKIYESYTYDNKAITLGKPTNTDNYIYLPVVGYYIYTGQLNRLGERSYFWASTPRPDLTSNAYNLYVERGAVHTGYGDRRNAHCLWSTFSTE